MAGVKALSGMRSRADHCSIETFLLVHRNLNSGDDALAGLAKLSDGPVGRVAFGDDIPWGRPLAGMVSMKEAVARIRIELRDLEPKIWRRVDVPLSSTLEALHHVIQASFRWQDYHWYEFAVGDRIYGVPTDDDILSDRKTCKASALRLQTLVERGVDRFLYVYDFGDDWRHDVIVEELRDGD